MLRSKISIVAALAAGLLMFGQPVFSADEHGVAAASTKVEHQTAAVAYEKEATDLRLKAEKHMKESKHYKSGGNPKVPTDQIARHCESLSKQYSDAAKENDALAKLHRDMAAMVAK